MNEFSDTDMTAAALCQSEVITTTGDMNLIDAAALMRDYHVGCLVVIEQVNGRVTPIGIVTDRDIVVQIIALNIPCEDVFIRELIGNDFYTVNGQQNIFSVFKYMQQTGVRRLPVVDDLGGLMGIITFDDLVGLFTSELADLSRVIKHEQIIEKIKRKQI